MIFEILAKFLSRNNCGRAQPEKNSLLVARLPEPFLGQLHVREVLYTTRNSITSGFFLQSAATNSFHRRAMQLGWLTASPCQTQ
jgi:hypothetical protein